MDNNNNKFEEFVEIVGYDRYYISNYGNVWSDRSNRFLKQSWDSVGYLKVNLFCEGKVKTYNLHKLVASAFCENPNNCNRIDHIDTNKENNNSENLRFCTTLQNNWNRSKTTKQTSSKYKGVVFNKRSNKYHARIRIHGKLKHIGLFANEDDAARAYNIAAEELQGEFYKPNIIN